MRVLEYLLIATVRNRYFDWKTKLCVAGSNIKGLNTMQMVLFSKVGFRCGCKVCPCEYFAVV